MKTTLNIMLATVFAVSALTAMQSQAKDDSPLIEKYYNGNWPSDKDCGWPCSSHRPKGSSTMESQRTY